MLGVRTIRGAGVALLMALPGCGSELTLPTETPLESFPAGGSYRLIETWAPFDGVRDVLITQGVGSQLYVVLNTGGSGTVPRGAAVRYPRFASDPPNPPSPISGTALNSLFNPIAIAAGSDRLYVLDAGDTALARDPVTHRVRDFSLFWRVRVYALLRPFGQNDTLTTLTGFTDSTVAEVKGIAADDLGRVYVSCLAVILVPDQSDPRIFTREFQNRIYRYAPGPLPGGVADSRMPGSNWHRDDSYIVLSGSGTESVNDPRGIFVSAFPPPAALYVSDFGNNAVKALSLDSPPSGFLRVDRDTSRGGKTFLGAEDVTTDASGYFYAVDPGNQRVLRFVAGSGDFVQRVDEKLGTVPPASHYPQVVAANDSLVYVWSRSSDDSRLINGRILLYYRRPQ